MINTKLLLTIVGASMIYESSTDVPLDIIREIVDKTLDEVVLPSMTKSRSRRAYQQDNRNKPAAKRRKVKYDRKRAHNAVMSDYLGPNWTFCDRQFERVFRITTE